MKKVLQLMKALRKDEEGATAIEYGLLAALIAVGIIAAVTSLSDGLNATFDEVTAELSEAEGGEEEEAPAE